MKASGSCKGEEREGAPPKREERSSARLARAGPGPGPEAEGGEEEGKTAGGEGRGVGGGEGEERIGGERVRVWVGGFHLFEEAAAAKRANEIGGR